MPLFGTFGHFWGVFWAFSGISRVKTRGKIRGGIIGGDGMPYPQEVPLLSTFGYFLGSLFWGYGILAPIIPILIFPLFLGAFGHFLSVLSSGRGQFWAFSGGVKQMSKIAQK